MVPMVQPPQAQSHSPLRSLGSDAARSDVQQRWRREEPPNRQQRQAGQVRQARCQHVCQLVCRMASTRLGSKVRAFPPMRSTPDQATHPCCFPPPAPRPPSATKQNRQRVAVCRDFVHETEQRNPLQLNPGLEDAYYSWAAITQLAALAQANGANVAPPARDSIPDAKYTERTYGIEAYLYGVHRLWTEGEAAKLQRSPAGGCARTESYQEYCTRRQRVAQHNTSAIGKPPPQLVSMFVSSWAQRRWGRPTSDAAGSEQASRPASRASSGGAAAAGGGAAAAAAAAAVHPDSAVAKPFREPEPPHPFHLLTTDPGTMCAALVVCC